MFLVWQYSEKAKLYNTVQQRVSHFKLGLPKKLDYEVKKLIRRNTS